MNHYDKFRVIEALAWLAMILVVVVIVALLLTSCQATGVDAAPELVATATAPVSTGDVAGDVTTFNTAGNASWGIAGLLALLWMSTWRGRSVATTALHRCVDAMHYATSDYDRCRVKDQRTPGWFGYDFDAPEHLIRKRLAKLKGKGKT